MKERRNKHFGNGGSITHGLILLWTLLCLNASAGVRFEERIHFEQPDGTVIELQGEGNEYRAVYETLDGYTVVFVPEAKAYFYAVLSASGDELLSSGLQVGHGPPESLGLQRHARIAAPAARDQARRARQESESRMRLPERWAKLKASASQSGELRSQGTRYGNTIGTKVGLTLLIDFDDLRGTFAPSNVVQFLNGDNYRANGNRGSVKEYFAEVSGGKLLYTNVVIGYIRIPNSLRPRSYYNDLNRITRDPGNELIRDAIRIMTNQPNHMSEIVPQLETLSEDDNGHVIALNVFVAGNHSGVWAKGIWPHAASLDVVGPQELWPGGKKVNNYQMTQMPGGTALTIGTFCHETGHLLCDFPDVYDYDDASAGGSGNFCLMGAGGYNGNPQHVSAYLKLMAGWATAVDIRSGPATTMVLNAAGTNAKQLLRFTPATGPGIVGSPEYFLIENRQKTGRDAEIPGGGILVWHIDERGDHNNENVLPNSLHANYEVSLVQADGRFDLQDNRNLGDATDPFFRGNPRQNRFADDTTPSASWWDGTRSGLELRDFSVRSNQMTLVAEVKRPRILRDPISQTVNRLDDLFLSVQMSTNQPYTYLWFKGSLPLAGHERITGVDGPVLAVYDVNSSDAGAYRVVITDQSGHSETSRVAQVSISVMRSLAGRDLGDASYMSGTARTLANDLYISAGGSGLAGAADNCRFLFETVTGDFDARLQIKDMNPEDGRSIHRGGAGLMVRAGLEAGSAQSSVLVRPGFLDTGELQALARPHHSDAVREMARIGGIQPRNNWVRLRREGTLVSMYYSTNGARWDWLETVSLPLSSDAMVGIAATSYNPTLRIVAGVSSYTVATNLPSTFAISALKNSAQEGANDRATLVVVGSRNGPLEIPYTIRDSSANGVLYQTLSGRLSLPAGTNVALLEIVPINNSTASPPHTVSLSLPSSGVIQSVAQALIFDDEERGHGLKKEYHLGIVGTKVTDLTGHFRYFGAPQLMTVPNFESTIAQQSGQVLSGFITPPATGAYTFYLASANASELWLSSDENPANSVKIAEELGANTKRNWPGYGALSHISAPISLTQGRWYSVRAIHKAGFGVPHLAVGWKLPGGEAPLAGSEPIGGEYLTWTVPNGAPTAGATLRIATSPAGKLLLTVESATLASFTLEASSDLVRWQPIHADLSTAELDLFSLDPSSSARTNRFFRLMRP